MTTYKLVIQYEGTRYKGWQRLKTSDQTIQFKIEQVLSRLFDEAIEIQGSGRTDAGVHALGQVASFKSQKKLDSRSLMLDLNKYLPEDIVVTSVSYEAESFHARFNAKDKTYVFQLWTADHPPVFDRNFVVDLEGRSLDIELMKKAANLFLGKHDFKSFSTDKTKKSSVRTIHQINFVEEENILKIVFTGDGFLYNMVRIIVGTLIEIGLGHREIASVTTTFEKGQREFAGATAPAKGLFLLEVTY